MSSLLTLFGTSFLLGVGAFGMGMVPLALPSSKIYTSRLQTLGTGLLLGTALGVIIPEGIQTLAFAHHSSELPVSKISLSLLVGFVFMFLVELFASPHSHSHVSSAIPLHHDEGPMHDHTSSIRRDTQAYPLTLGLLIHALVDGLALAVSALSDASEDSPDTSLVVFMALFIHKAPTAIALTTSLLSTTISRSECKKHLIAFSASTPFGAFLSYLIFSLLGLAESHGDWTGIALLISGGSFLYVATVLQPISHAREDGNTISQALLVIIGMFLPFAVGSIIGHGHHHHLHGTS